MAPFGDFPTFKTRNEYVITEVVEPFFLIGAVIVSFGILVLITAILYSVSWHCCSCFTIGCIYRKVCNICCCRDKPRCERDCTCANKCNFFLGQILSSIFDIIEMVEDQGKSIILFAKRRQPTNTCSYVFVLVYFITLFILLVLLFLSMFSNFFIYRKTSACNDINVKTEKSICFDIDNGYEVVDCLHVDSLRHEDLNVICYLTDWGPFRALGIAFGAIQAIRALISILFSFGIKLGLMWPQLTKAIQFVGVLVANVPNIVVYRVFHMDVLYGEPPLLHLTLWLVWLIVVVLVAGLPWWAFEESAVFEKKTRTVEETGTKYLADVETFAAQNNM